MSEKQNEPGVLIVLAAGKSLRMGSPKGLLQYGKKYWIEEQLLRASKANFEKVIIVLGYDKQKYFEKVPILKNAFKEEQKFKTLMMKVVVNENPHLGPFSSILEVLKCIETEKSVFVLPVDVPLLPEEEVQKLRNSKGLVAIPKFNNKKGHPVKLAFDFWKDIKQVAPDDVNARLDHQIKFLDKENVDIISVNSVNAILNLNTPESWSNFLKLNK